jgi:hypothetical protein
MKDKASTCCAYTSGLLPLESSESQILFNFDGAPREERGVGVGIGREGTQEEGDEGAEEAIGKVERGEGCRGSVEEEGLGGGRLEEERSLESGSRILLTSASNLSRAEMSEINVTRKKVEKRKVRKKRKCRKRQGSKWKNQKIRKIRKENK